MNKKINYMALVYSAVLVAALFSVAPAFAACVTDQGAYKDDWGFAKFPHYNGCKNVSASVYLCTKSMDGYYNRYYMSLNAKSYGEITGGKWAHLHSYSSNETGYDCSF